MTRLTDAAALRPVTTSTADIVALRDIARQTFTETFQGATSDADMYQYLDEAYAPEVLAAEVADPRSRVWFLDVDGAPAAYLKVNVGQAQTESMPAGWVELQRIYVLAEHKGHGLGTKLIRVAHQWARDQQADHLWLGVWEHNAPAQAFYRRYGFTRIGEHTFYTGTVAQTDWLLAASIADLGRALAMSH